MADQDTDDILTECMRLAAQEKITTKNSWDLQLIDHIDDLIDPTSCDFVRLGGAVNVSAKIYSCRVDNLFQQCAQVAGLTGNADAEDKIQTTRQKRQRQKNANIDADPEQLMLQQPINTDFPRISKLYQTLETTQQIKNLPMSRCRVLADFSLSSSRIDSIDYQYDVEKQNGLLVAQTQHLLAQSQRYVDEPTGVEEVEFVCQPIEVQEHHSMLDNTAFELEVSQLNDDQVDVFVRGNRFIRIDDVEDASQPTPSQPAKPGLQKPGLPKGPKLPKAAKPADVVQQINFAEPLEIQMVSPKQLSRVNMRLREVEVVPVDLFCAKALPAHLLNYLMLADHQALQMSKMMSNVELSAAPAGASFGANASLNGEFPEQEAEDRFRPAGSEYYKSEAAERQLDVQIGLQNVQIKFQQRPKVINIQQLKAQMREEFGVMKCNCKFSQMVSGYQRYHVEKVSKNIEDVSPAYQFVALLHLANEEGIIMTQDGKDIRVVK